MSINFSGPLVSDPFLRKTAADPVGIFIVSEDADIRHPFRSVPFAVYSYIYRVAAGEVHSLVHIAVRHIVADSNQFHCVQSFPFIDILGLPRAL